MSTPNEQLFTIAAVGRVDQEHVRVDYPVDVVPGDRRVFVWAGGHTRLTFESPEDVEVFAQLLLDRLTDLQFAEHAAHHAMPYVPDAAALDRLLAAVHGQPVETVEVEGDVL